MIAAGLPHPRRKHPGTSRVRVAMQARRMTGLYYFVPVCSYRQPGRPVPRVGTM